MDKVIVGITGILLSVFVVWFFFGKREKATTAALSSGVQEVQVLVDGGYTPDVLQVRKGIPVRLSFFRKDPSSCLEEVVLGDFNIRTRLNLNESTAVEFTPQKEGVFDFSCGMGMFHGKIVVR